MIQGYIIKDLNTGLFSKGGTNPLWKKAPKVWSQISHVKNHLNQFVYIDYKNKTIHIRNAYKDCVVLHINGEETDCDIMKYLRSIAIREQNKKYSEYVIVEDE